MQVISEIRGAHAAHDQETMARLLLETRGSERYADVYTYATALDADVLSLERLAQWAEWTPTPSTTNEKSRDGLWWIDEDEWCLRVCGVVLATHETLDIQPLQHAWSTVPARAALPVWEDWAREHAREHLEAPRQAIEVKEAWCRGEVDDEALQVARDAAWAAARAAWAARDAAWAAARDAAWAAASAARAAAEAARDAAWAAASAARDAAWDARDAARDAAWAAARDAARDAAYQRWCDVWTAYVIDRILNPNQENEQ